MKTLFLIFSFWIFVPAFSQDDFDKMIKSECDGTIPYIKPSELNQKIEDNEQIYILDTRTLKEYNISYVSGAIHVGFVGFSPKQIKEVEKDALIFVYCTIGARSESIGEKIVKKGYTNVYNLYGGIINWVNNGYPVYNSKGNLTKDVHVYSKSWGKWLKKGNPVY